MLRDVIKPVISSVLSDVLGSVSVIALFAGGVVGLWFDPNDRSTLFQDTAGTTQITAPGQTAALMLDKSKGLSLGPELVVNGDFSAGFIGWSDGSSAGGVVTISGGVATLTNTTGTARLNSSSAIAFSAGKTYEISWTQTGASLTFYSDTGGTILITAATAGSNKLKFVAQAGSNGLSIRNFGAGTSAAVDNISVKLLAGNHAVQATAAQRPTYGVIPYGGVRNFIPYSSDLSQASWAKGTECSVSNSGQLTPNGNTAWLATFSGTTSNAVVYDTGHAVSVGQIVTFSGWVKAGTAPDIYLRIANGDGTILQAVNITPTATWTRFSLTATITVAGANSFGQVRGSTTTAGTVLVGDFQYEYSASQTPFQKTVTKYNTTEAGKATIGALFCDGIDDGMVTPSIDFSGTDKMTVWAGLQKMSDAAQGIVTELSPTNSSPGMFNLQAPGPGVSYRFASGGSFPIAGVADAVGIAAPTASILTGIADISIDKAILQVNGVQVASSGNDQGTGNYGNYPLYLFRRGGSSLPYNGIFTGLIVRGAASTPSQIKDGNTYINSKFGAY